MRVRQAAVLVSGLLFLSAMLIGGCGGGSSVTSPGDLPMVTLGGYSFGPNSAKVNHPWFVAAATTRPWVLVAWGSGAPASSTLTYSFSDGGLVTGVRTLRMTETAVFGKVTVSASGWLAQDSQGNIHALQEQKAKRPKKLLGVASGGAARLLLPCAAQITTRRLWYDYFPGSKTHRESENTILSTNATSRGRRGLLQEQAIEDTDGNGVFSPTWEEPDTRRDFFYAKRGGFRVVQLSATYGYARRP